VTVSQPIKIVALVGLLVAVAGGGLFTLRMRHQPSSTPPLVNHPAHPAVTSQVTTPAGPKPHAKPATPATTPEPARPVLQLDPGLPPTVRDALEHSRAAVVFVYSASTATDRALRSEVAAGAQEAGVPFVSLDVDRNSVAAAVFGWTAAPADPETFVVRRPGRVAFTLVGMTDATAVAEGVESTK
jgi:hypothetical protein